MTAAGWVGVALFVAAVIGIVVEGVLAGVWSRGTARKARRLSELVERESRLNQAELARLRVAVEQTKVLWQPYQQLLRRVRHPLVLAALRSLARRAAASR